MALAQARLALRERDDTIGRMALRLIDTQRRLDSAETWLAALRASTSWRLTGPLRRLARLVSLLITRRRDEEPAGLPLIAPDAPEPQVQEPAPLATLTSITWATGSQRGGLRTVHQVHPGSAHGDAITNAMLLTRALLRAQGYRSEIFVEHVAPELADELRPWTELPDHDGYVLIVRVSGGYPQFARIAALPARKVLIYHNITPEALLAGAPALQRFVRQGREQLPQWRHLVEAALADSEINALELRRAGFDNPIVCPLLFDIAALRQAAPRQADAGRPFTVLFVGRLVASKGQDTLIAAFQRFAAAFDAPCRLVLIGGQSAGDAYVATLRAAIAAVPPPAEILLTGHVSDAALETWFGRADLYVSLSLHEGFGVPLVEAMARGVPVLAWPCSAVPYTLGEAGALLDSRDPAEVAARMLNLARDQALRTHLRERQTASLDRFRLDRHVPRLLQALSLAGAALPQPAGGRAALARHLSFTVTGHINGSYSLAAVNRALAQAIAAEMPGRVRIVPVEGAATADLSGVPDGELAAITRLASRGRPATGPEIVISQHYPLLIPAEPGDAAQALFFWEESLVPQETVRALDSGFRAVLAPSRSVARALVDSGLRCPVHVVGQAPELAPFRALRAVRGGAARGRTFTFLHVSSAFPRKGVDVLLAAFTRAFGKADPVRLVIKCFPNPHNDVADRLHALRRAEPDLAEIELIDRDLDQAGLIGLMREADAMVLPTRGEGFNLPAAEAMAAGLPLIVTGHGGHMDFCDDGVARLLAWRPARSGSHVATRASLWAEPSEDDLVAALRELAFPDAHGRALIVARVAAAAARVDCVLAPPVLLRRLIDASLDAVTAAAPGPVRIAWVSTWGQPCGIATYSRALLDRFPDSDIAGLTLIADTRGAAGEACLDSGLAADVRPVWRAGDPAQDPSLPAAIAVADPDVVMIQHQPGLIPWPSLARLVASRQLAGRAVCVTLHNTWELEEIAMAGVIPSRPSVIAALGGCTRLLVHTVADLRRLRSLGLGDNATLLPHGADVSGAPPPRLRDLAEGGAPVIGCFGFFLPGKGIRELIVAAATLRRRWPGLRLELVNARYGQGISTAEIESCRAEAERCGMRDAITWHQEFLTPDAARALLRGCDLVVLPYQASREAASGAVRMALTSGVPVAVTPLAVFDDTEDAVIRLAGTAPAAIAEGVAALLDDVGRRRAVQAAARAWLADKSWESIAERLHGMLVGLGRAARSGSEEMQRHAGGGGGGQGLQHAAPQPEQQHPGQDGQPEAHGIEA